MAVVASRWRGGESGCTRVLWLLPAPRRFPLLADKKEGWRNAGPLSIRSAQGTLLRKRRYVFILELFDVCL